MGMMLYIDHAHEREGKTPNLGTSSVATSQPPVPPFNHLEADELGQEYRDFLSLLPKVWCDVTYLYQYEGFWQPSIIMRGVLECQRNFKAQDTDILLVTNPKSGTTWLKAIVFSLLNRTRFPDTQHHPLLTSNPHTLVPFLEVELYNKEVLPDLTPFTPPRLFSTHLPFVSLPKSVQDSTCKLVYLCRNPKDSFVSHWHFTKRFRRQNSGNNYLEEVFDLFCKGVSHCGPFWDHVLGYWKESLEKPHKVLFLTYEEMKEQPACQIRRLAEFLSCPFSPEEEKERIAGKILSLCSFDNLNNLEVNKIGKQSSGVQNSEFFRQGKVGDWKNYLTPTMVDRLDKITKEKFSGSGLELIF